MGLFRRLSATISSTVEQAVTRVENHDAIVAAAIKSTQSNAAKAKVRLARVQKDGEVLRTRSKELQTAERTWGERAKACAESDKEKALECIKRRKVARGQLTKIQESLVRHSELEAQVLDTLKKIESRLLDMKQQRNMMRSRESVADAMRIITDIDGAAVNDIDETFDRWEILITESELCSNSLHPVDVLDADFQQSEDRLELEAELDSLLHDKEGHHDNDNSIQ
ncbi:MAG: PspA/IM30 family protein [Pseudomonadota bacterium]